MSYVNDRLYSSDAFAVCSAILCHGGRRRENLCFCTISRQNRFPNHFKRLYRAKEEEQQKPPSRFKLYRHWDLSKVEKRKQFNYKTFSFTFLTNQPSFISKFIIKMVLSTEIGRMCVWLCFTAVWVWHQLILNESLDKWLNSSHTIHLSFTFALFHLYFMFMYFFRFNSGMYL